MAVWEGGVAGQTALNVGRESRCGIFAGIRSNEGTLLRVPAGCC